MSSIFKVCLSVSVLAHTAFIMPYVFMPSEDTPAVKKPVELNYIIMEHPKLTSEKEVPGNKKSEEMSTRKNVVHSECPEGSGNKELTQVPKTAKTKACFGEQEAFLKYFNLIREKIRGELYDGVEWKNRRPVTLIFTLAPDGRLSGFDFETEDITSSLRSKVAKSLGKAEPFPPFPKELGRQALDFSLTIQFK